MSKLTPVTEYAERNKVSPESIIEKIKDGRRAGRIIDGVWYIGSGEEISKESVNQTAVNDYQTASVVHSLIEIFGWLFVVGSIFGLMTIGDGMLEKIPFIVGAGVGLLTVCAAQVVKAVVKTANNTSEIINLLKQNKE